jgi:cytoplasmic iron level regulating protein YaaA (DUF328/UPF0246 family)
MELQQKIQKDNAMLHIFDKKTTITDKALDRHVEAIAKKYECQNSRLSNPNCEKAYSDIVSIIEKKKENDLKELNKISEKISPSYYSKYTLTLENNEAGVSFFKKLIDLFF